jgi:uncharacterized coiled-coil DUF342 family protein
MGFADWFGGGGAALKAKVAQLETELGQAQAKVEDERKARQGLEKKLAEKETAAQEAREAKARVEKKLEKVQTTQEARGDRQAKIDKRIADLEAEATGYRQEMLRVKHELDDALAARHAA